MSTILLPIKPEFANAILEGKKTFEFRKTRCRLNVDRVVFYSSSPEKQVVGEAEIVDIIEDVPSKVWEITKCGAGISKEFFDSYYIGKRKAFAYHLKNIIKYDEPRSLADYGIKKAPQSFVYIK